jgi:hypothetical protein
VPRLINQVCDHALLLAYVSGQRQIEPGHIEEAWADLQQLPTPFNEESRDAVGSNVIEFGKLDDSPGEAEPPAAPPLRISPETDRADEQAAEPAEQLERIGRMLSDAEEDFQPAGSIRPEVELVFDEPERLLKEEFDEEEVVADRYLPAAQPDGSEDSETGRADPYAVPESIDADDHPSVETAEPEDADMVVVEDDDGDEGDDPLPVTCPIVPVRRQEYGRLFAKLRRG